MPKKRLPSLSKSALLKRCQAWAIDSSREYEKSLSAGDDLTAMNDGNDVHDAIDVGIKTGTPPILEKEPLNRMVAHAMELVAAYKEAGWKLTSEVCFQVSQSGPGGVPSASMIVLPGPREYPYLAGHVYGTADIVGTKSTADGKVTDVLVADWKTGGTDSAEDQLKSLGWAAWMVYPDANIHLQTLKLTEDSVWIIGYPDVGEPIGRTQLAEHWNLMSRSYKAVDAQKYKPNPGIHCTQLYCPHLAFCGAFEAAEAQASERESEGYTKLTDAPGSNSEAGKVMATLSAIKRRTKYYEAALKRYVETGGRVIAGDYIWSQGKDGFRWRKQK